jgi:hypothetical protein
MPDLKRWRQARGTTADLLWRIKKITRLSCDKRKSLNKEYWS